MTLDLLIVIPNRGEGKLTIEELENLRIERANTNSCYIPPGETLLKPPLEVQDFFYNRCIAITLGRVGGYQIPLRDCGGRDYMIIMQTEKGRCIQEDEEHTFLHELAHAWLADKGHDDSEDAVNAKVAEWLKHYEEGKCEK